jgi:hypothetical protein
MMRDVKLELTLDPIFWKGLPEVRIEFIQETLFLVEVDRLSTFKWTLPCEDRNRISVFFLNKVDADTVDNLDKAVIIKEISIEGMTYDSFLHSSKYEPLYSEGYYNYAQEKNITVDPIIHSNYMGFNGEWYLEFTWPVFTWIYKTEVGDASWIYEKNI